MDTRHPEWVRKVPWYAKRSTIASGENPRRDPSSHTSTMLCVWFFLRWLCIVKAIKDSDKLAIIVNELENQSRLRVGVIGLNMGQGHAETYKKLPNAELVAVCDKDAGWLDLCRHKWDVPYAFDDYREMLAMSDLDAVSIALPTFLHLPVALAAFEYGKHVLVEKPMAMDAAECERMAAASRAAGKTLMVSLNQRFDADVQYLKRYVEDGNLGEIYFARTLWRRPLGGLPSPTLERPSGTYTGRNWFNEASKGGGALRDLGAHVIDVALWLMGFPELADVSGKAYTMFLPEFLTGTTHVGDADDHSVGFARFKNGACLQIEVSYGQHIDHDELVTELFGSKGGAIRWSGRPLRLFGETNGAYSTTEPRLQEMRSTAHQEFVNSVLESRPPLVTPEQGITVTRIMDAIYAGRGPSPS